MGNHYENRYTVTYELDGDPVIVAYSNDVNDTNTNNYITALHAAKRAARQSGKPVTITCTHELPGRGRYYITTRTVERTPDGFRVF